MFIFKKCGKNKSKSIKLNKTNQVNINQARQILRELLPKLDAIEESYEHDDTIFITDKHFDFLSVTNPYHDLDKSNTEIFATDQDIIENDTFHEDILNELENSIEAALIINNRCIKVTEKHLKSLQCPFTWDLRLDTWSNNIVNQVENKYGKYNTNISSSSFSLKR